MAKQNMNINSTYSEINPNNFWLTHPPPSLMTSQLATPIYNFDYRTPFIHPNFSYNTPTSVNSMLSYNYNNSDIDFQNRFIPFNQNSSNSFPPLPDNIDEEYILKYLCPLPKPPKDETNVCIDNWLASKSNEITLGVKSTNVKINEISSRIKKCKILLENMKYKKQYMKQNISTMTETEWEKFCTDLFSIKEQLSTIVTALNLDDNSIFELKLKLCKRKKKRNRMKKIKSNLLIIKSQQKDEIAETNRKIDAWQNTLKENILNEIRSNETKMEANIVLKGVRGKIDDAKNRLSLFDTLDKLRKCRLQNCVNKRKNPLLEESLHKLRVLWQQKLIDYNKEEEELKRMLSKSETEKHEKREMEIQENLGKWDQLLFGPNFRSHEITYDSLHTFLDIRREWDKYIVNEASAESSNIPIGWIIPSTPNNSDWAKYLINVNAF